MHLLEKAAFLDFGLIFRSMRGVRTAAVEGLDVHKLSGVAIVANMRPT